MKKIFALITVLALTAALFSGCFGFGGKPSTDPTVTSSSETTESTTTEATTAATKSSSTEEFPTYEDDDNNYTEPQGRWSVNVPEVWDKYGKIIETKNGDSVRFVYTEAYEDYGAGHVFTICTTKASKKVDVTTYPHAEEIYLDKNIQIYVMYPTDVQFGGIDGSKMDEQSKEYSALYNTREEIIDSLKVL